MAGPPRSPLGLKKRGGFLPLSRAAGLSVVVLVRVLSCLLGGKAQGQLEALCPALPVISKGTSPFLVHLLSQEKELLEVTPPPTSVHEAIVQGDKRTYAVYDLLSPSLFNTSRSLNVQLKWKRPQDSCE